MKENNKNVSTSMLIVIIIALTMVNFCSSVYSVSSSQKSATEIFASVTNSVVEIKASKEDVGASYGTAVLIDDDGTLVTNAHVITYKSLGITYTFDEFSIRFTDEENFRQVELVKYDLNLDMAVLKLITDDKEISAIKLGDDTKLNFGDKVYAVGNMSNYGISLTTGNVSIPHVNVTYNENTRNVIQCDIIISDGNSGGALINSSGQLVGITTFRLKDNSGNVIYGIAYCIPINAVLEYINQI